jgi:four helix bundle suffix protein
MRDGERLIPLHGGYRNLLSFRVAQLVYDVTVRFCDRYIDKRSRTHDQMVQAARSGVQNIAEGSQASGTSKKTELRLTNVARASLEELRLDYEDFLRQRGRNPYHPKHPALLRFKARRCATLQDVQTWVREERHIAAASQAVTGEARARPCLAVSPSSELVANAALSLLNVACHLLGKQITTQEKAFLREGGFTERLYQFRSKQRGR